jgi:hypothetical protein
MFSAGKSKRVASVPNECWKQRATRVVCAADNEKTQKLKQEHTRTVSKLEAAQRKIDQLNMQLNECKQKVFSSDRVQKEMKQKHENQIAQLENKLLSNLLSNEREVGCLKDELYKLHAHIIKLKDSSPVSGDDEKRTVKEIKRKVLCDVLTKNPLFDSITADVMQDPVLLCCGHASSKKALDTWWAKRKHHNQCPFCRQRTGVYANLF